MPQSMFSITMVHSSDPEFEWRITGKSAALWSNVHLSVDRSRVRVHNKTVERPKTSIVHHLIKLGSNTDKLLVTSMSYERDSDFSKTRQQCRPVSMPASIFGNPQVIADWMLFCRWALLGNNDITLLHDHLGERANKLLFWE
jgi:hypothetical protein